MEKTEIGFGLIERFVFGYIWQVAHWYSLSGRNSVENCYMTASDPAFPFSALNHKEIIQKKNIFFTKIFIVAVIFEL